MHIPLALISINIILPSFYDPCLVSLQFRLNHSPDIRATLTGHFLQLRVLFVGEPGLEVQPLAQGYPNIAIRLGISPNLCEDFVAGTYGLLEIGETAASFGLAG